MIRRLSVGIGLLVFVLMANRAEAAIISEFEPNPAGLDPEIQSIELSGTAGNSFSGILLGIGGESGRIGQVDYATEIAGIFDSQGIFSVEIGDLLSPTLTVVLTESFAGTVGQTDVDTNDDGVADNLSTFGIVHDAIGIADNSLGESFLYGNQLGGQDFAFTGDEPELIFRDSSIGSWYAINDRGGADVFDISGRNIAPDVTFSSNPFITTFGQINPSISSIPEPSIAISGCTLFAMTVLVRRGRRK